MINLLKSMVQKDNVMIYTRDSGHKFSYGKVLEVDGNYVAVSMISPVGNFDGIEILQIEEILRLEMGGLYEEKMRNLCKHYLLQPFEHSLKGDDLRMCMLEIAKKTKKIVSIELINSGDNDIVGVVERINDTLVMVKLIDEYGKEDGVSFFDVEDITHISYCTEEEQCIQKLWEKQ